VPATKSNKTLALFVAILSLLPAATSADEKQLSVYAPVATYTLPVLQGAGREYVGLLELLEPLGRVSGEAKGNVWRMRYNTVEGEFIVGRTRARIHGRDVDLTAPFLIENSRGLVPVASLGSLLPQFLGTPVSFHESARRLFIGEAGIQPSFHLESGPQPRLILKFGAPVNPTISTEPGKLRMVFKHDPVVSPGSQPISFENSPFTQASFSEANGVAELDVTAGIPLIASFSDGAKTITLSAAPMVENAPPPAAGTPATPTQQAQAPAQPPAQTEAPPSTSPNAPPPIRRVLAVVDPAHGGDERGAALTDQLAEKDVTLGLARLLRHELELAGFAVVLLREGDNSMTLDDRAGRANAAGAAVFISLHAASQGSGALVYTALLPVEEPAKGTFRAWNSAQALALPTSRAVANAVVAELQKRQFPARQSSASLRPLNNVVIPAVAVELAPGPNGTSDLSSAVYQQQAAAAIAAALVGIRDKLAVAQ
jgi:N-acetylmuramoyl-L-alanine amidase